MTVNRVERRYLVDDPSDVLDALGPPAEMYQVTTYYLLDGDPDLKYRLRFYNDDHLGYFENKQRQGNRITKSRVPSPTCRGDAPPGFTILGCVTYDRKAWAIGDVRVTVDTKVNNGSKQLPGSVVEVKGDTVPDLPLPSKAKFSKRSWALA